MLSMWLILVFDLTTCKIAPTAWEAQEPVGKNDTSETRFTFLYVILRMERHG